MDWRNSWPNASQAEDGKGTTINPKINLIRYADDFIITGATKEVLENEVRPLVEQFLRERGLQLSPEKTCITHIDEGFDFLGQNLRKFDGKLLVKPSKKNTHAFLEKVRGIIKANKSASQENLIRLLNPVIRGWANYHRHIVATEVFQRADYEIWRTLAMGKTQTSRQSAQWVRKRYFHPIGERTGCLRRTPENERRRGNPSGLSWFMPATPKSGGIVKIRADANPFDPDWQEYFAGTRVSEKVRHPSP